MSAHTVRFDHCQIVIDGRPSFSIIHNAAMFGYSDVMLSNQWNLYVKNCGSQCSPQGFCNHLKEYDGRIFVMHFADYIAHQMTGKDPFEQFRKHG